MQACFKQQRNAIIKTIHTNQNAPCQQVGSMAYKEKHAWEYTDRDDYNSRPFEQRDSCI